MSIPGSALLGESLRTYSVALAFALGQIAPLALTPPRQPPAIVRTQLEDGDGLGFDPRERPSANLILTMPLVSGVAPIAGQPGPEQRRDPAWLRNN